MTTIPEPPHWQKPRLFYGKPLTFNERNHRYYWNGQAVPSVTTIINRLSKPLLIQWAADMAVDHIEKSLVAHLNFKVVPEGVLKNARKAHIIHKEAAGDVGKRVHKYAQMILQRQSPPEPLDGPAQKAIEAFWQWVEQHRIQVLDVERRILSAEHMYAGTCDFFGHINDRLAVLDFKTGNGVYDEAWWQTAGYSEALLEELPDSDIPVRWIVHLNKTTGEMTPHCRDSIEDWGLDRAVWRGLVSLDKALRQARKHPQPKKVA